MDFEQKRNLKRILFSKTSVVILALLVILLMRATWSIYTKVQLTRANLDTINRDYTKLKSREVDLTKHITDLQSGDGIEAQIRQKFRVIKAGEQIAVIVNDPNAIPQATTTPSRTL